MLFTPVDLPIAEPVVDVIEDTRKSKRQRALEQFFKEQKAHSAVKTAIVTKYFPRWLDIIKRRARSKKLGYVDLYAGPGKYDDGKESTPLLIMRHILAHADLREVVLTLFTDKKAKYVRALEKNISALSGIESLQHRPQIERQSADESTIPEYFENKSIIPTFMFLDPFGYSGLSLKLIGAVLKDWACEVMFFWNFNRINGALRHRGVRPKMDAIFGHERVDALRERLKTATTETERESVILGALRDALDEAKGRYPKQYMEAFRFRNVEGRITHHLVFVTKDILGQRIVKDIMAKESSWCDPDGIASFEYNPNPPPPAPPPSLLDGAPVTPMQRLKNELLERFRGRQLTVAKIYEEHNYGTPYIQKNYQEALKQLYYDEGKVSLTGGDFMPILRSSLKQRYMSPKYIVTFNKV